MQYSTKIDKTSDTLREVAEMAAHFEEDRVLAAILSKRLSHDDVVEYTLRLREKSARLKREIESLRRFSSTFNKEYATDRNKCFSAAQQMFGIIRSNMSETIRLFRTFCPKVMERGPIVDGVEQRPSVLDHTMLNCNVPYTPNAFGMEGCDNCVKDFIDQLQMFFGDIEDALMMCNDVLQEEGSIRHDAVRCTRLYKHSFDKVLERSHEFLEYFGPDGFAREDQMSAEMHKLPTLQDFACDHFHQHNKNEFQIHVLHKTYSEGKANDLTDIETYLWPQNHALALQARVVVEHFDELGPKGRQQGDTGIYRLSGKHVAVFMKWCQLKDTMKEKHFVEKYFNQTYHGVYRTVASSTVNTAKNKLLTDETSEREIIDEIKKLIGKYCK